jgi:hypothetical protein
MDRRRAHAIPGSIYSGFLQIFDITLNTGPLLWKSSFLRGSFVAVRMLARGSIGGLPSLATLKMIVSQNGSVTGAGVAQDKTEAARWMRLAAEAGDQASRVDLANLVMQALDADSFDETGPSMRGGHLKAMSELPAPARTASSTREAK